jgi:hypothetical protein
MDIITIPDHKTFLKNLVFSLTKRICRIAIRKVTRESKKEVDAQLDGAS